MISPEKFISHLEGKGFHFYTGVPCSYFNSVIRSLESHTKSSYVIAPNEGSALALASGAYLGGQLPVIMIQNSGLGNLINPLTSLNLIYEIPVLIFVSGRAYGIPDEPQHEIIGKTMGKLLDSIGILHWDLPTEEENLAGSLDEGIQAANQRKSPVVFFVKKGTFTPWPQPSNDIRPKYPMTRIEAIRLIDELTAPEDLVISTTGKISRELFLVHDKSNHFYMQGSMGHASSIALGVALSKTNRRIIVLDGDGAFMMHMGSIPMIGHCQPKKFIHIVLDNESYETTGDQDTISSNVDFEQIAKASGYCQTHTVSNAAQLRAALSEDLDHPGPILIRVKINRFETKGVPRITTRHSAPQITQAFREAANQEKLIVD